MTEKKKPQKRNLTDAQKKAKSEYDTKYILAHQKQRKILFNDLIPEDMEMLAWVDSQPNKNQYVKGLIRKDMDEAGK